MFILTANIDIISESGKIWTFDKVQEVKIERDSEKLTDTCTITLPRKVKWKDEVDVPIQRGDKVVVKLGKYSPLQNSPQKQTLRTKST